MPKLTNKVPIKYTSRDFESIKGDLKQFARRYYPDTFKDFSEASFGALVLDSVAYVGDVLSYYLDYHVNESFMDTAIEYNNIRKHARSLGYKYAGTANSYGTVAMYVIVPANSDGSAPQTAYIPTVNRGTTFNSSTGGSFMLTEDVRFADPKNEIVAARFNSTTGQTSYFAIRAFGQVVSGQYQRAEADLSSSIFERFKKIRIGDNLITEIISVFDDSGNEYYEVENLAQEVIFKETTNRNASSDGIPSILKPFVASRRFVMEQDDTGTYIQFGFGSETDEDVSLADPSKVVLKMNGRAHITDKSFDPANLLGTNKFGVSPDGSILTITYKINDSTNINAPIGAISVVASRDISFDDETSLSVNSMNEVVESLEVYNEETITGDSVEITGEELKTRAKAFYATQNRAVTKQDYESLVYNMPAKFGFVKRVKIVNDPSATNKRIAMYIMSEDQDGMLVAANSTLKNNLKTWLSNYKGMNDIIDVFDAKVVNFGIDFTILSEHTKDTRDVMFLAIEEIKDYFNETAYIGEPIYLSNVYDILNKTSGVVDVKKVSIFPKTGDNYSSDTFDFDLMMSKDGTYLKAPRNVVFELKYPNLDIKGVVK